MHESGFFYLFETKKSHCFLSTNIVMKIPIRPTNAVQSRGGTNWFQIKTIQCLKNDPDDPGDSIRQTSLPTSSDNGEYMLLPSSNGLYQCLVCNKIFRTKCHLTDHMTIHTVKNKWMVITEIKSENSKTHDQLLFTNSDCTVKLPNNSVFKIFKCPICDKMFSTKGPLADHITRHTGEHPYHCTLCPAKFSYRMQLRRHRQRTGH